MKVRNKANQSAQKLNLTPKEYAELENQEQRNWIPVKFKYERVPLWCKIALIICLISILLYIVMCISRPFADFFNLRISSVFRMILANITNIFPFSLAELCIILLPLTLFIIIGYFCKYRCNTPKSTKVSIICVFSAASIFLSGFIITFAPAYRGSTIEDKLNINAQDVDKYDLFYSAEYLVEQINELSKKINYSKNGFSDMPYSFGEMNALLLDAYDDFCNKNDFIYNFHSRLKPVALSEALSYAHITGVYTFVTGESNINVDFPDYNIPFTSAHELAHQRGIGREDEANMIAFLISMESKDDYIRYSAYVNMYEYFANALYTADKELFKKVDSKLDYRVYAEQIAYAQFFKKYEKSVTSQISGTVNDVYLKGQGTEGKKSYGMVVDLGVAYFKNQRLIPN